MQHTTLFGGDATGGTGDGGDLFGREFALFHVEHNTLGRVMKLFYLEHGHPTK
jgi:hypothetical protein